MNYHCIVADPPWRFNDRNTRGAAEKHYETMSLVEIAALGEHVKQWADENCHLWLWTPNAFLLDGSAQQIAGAWGFQPRQICTWIKPCLGVGHYLRNTTEQVIFCTRGKQPPMNRKTRTHFMAIRREHSVKPPEFFNIVESMSPGPRLEMFARAARPGWDSWGNEAPTETRIAI